MELVKTHTFTGDINKEAIRVWVDPAWLSEHGYDNVMDSYNGGFGNYNFTRNTAWSGGKVTGYFIALQERMDPAKSIAGTVTNLGTTPESVGGTTDTINEVHGHVFWDWDYTPGLTGDPMDQGKDTKAGGGIKVYVSEASSQNGPPEKTWLVETNSKGYFQHEITVRASKYYSVFVETPPNTSQWTPIGPNHFLKPLTFGRGTSTGIGSLYWVKIALRPVSANFELVNYDAISNFASPGDTAYTEATGWAPSGTYAIVWEKMVADENGNVSVAEVSRQEKLTPNAEGVIPSSQYQVPQDTTETTRYRALLLSPVGDIAMVDSLVAVVPGALTPIGAEGVAYTGEVYNPNQHNNTATGEVEDLTPVPLPNHTYTYSVDTTSPEAIEGAFGELPVGLSLDTDTGKITGTPGEDTAGAYKVRFKITGSGPAIQNDPSMPPVTPPSYEVFVEKTIYILDGAIPNPAMEGRAIDGGFV